MLGRRRALTGGFEGHLHWVAVKRVLILGSTGSIGTQALDVISRSDGLRVAALSAESNWEPLIEQAREHGVPAVALADPEAAVRATDAWGGTGSRRRAGNPRADPDLQARSGSQRRCRRGRPRADDRRPHRGHRRRPRQQGEPCGWRRAGHRAGRGHRRADHPGRLRALGAVPAGRGGAARPRGATGPHRLGWSVPRTHRPLRRDAG